MNTRKIQENPSNAITTNIDGVREILGVGRSTALKVGKESGAMIKVGRRTLYKVDILKQYVNSL